MFYYFIADGFHTVAGFLQVKCNLRRKTAILHRGNVGYLS